MELITVITIAYNTEKYIEKCIESVLDQDYSNIEYLLIDNGSTDKTKSIIKTYAQNYNTIKYIRYEKNTVNLLEDIIKEHCNGEYCIFLDSDDYFENNCLSSLYGYTKQHNLDICIGSALFTREKDGNTFIRGLDKTCILSNYDIAPNIQYLYQFFRTLWGKLYKTSLLSNIHQEKRQIMLKARYGADTFACLEMVKNSHKLGIIPSVIYNYIIREKSISYVYNPYRFEADCAMYTEGITFLSFYGDVSISNRCFFSKIYLNAIIDTLNVLMHSSLSIEEKIDNVKNIITSDYTTNMFKEIAQEDVKVQQFADSVLNMLCEIESSYDTNRINKKIEKISQTLIKNAYPQYNENIFLAQIKNKELLVKQKEMITHILNKKYRNAIEIAYKVGEMQGYSEDLLILLVNLSAADENAESFIYAQKLQACYYIKLKDKQKAQKCLYNLEEVIKDNDTTMLKKEIEYL